MEEDDERLCRFGTPLEPLEEDEIPSKKPIQIEDQIVTDSNGRRRFHGAFTGGFSAGFWNTVGSLEGWQPQSFKSSRSEKAGSKILQKPTDFMDEEDLGEFGIAPQRVQTTEDFTPQDSNSKSTKRKRKLQNSIGPIPGIPVLNQLLQPAKENVAIRLLKKMGWKMGQGIGARQTRKEKKAASERNARERYVMKKYGCDLGPIQNEPQAIKDVSDDDVSDISDEEITFAPEDFEPFLCGFKDNSFGLGYSGLSRDPVLKKQQQHIDLFGPFEVLGKDNKKLSIRGQAFGVGALEEEDEDIYNHDDLTKYDFSLGDIKKAAKPKRQLREADSFVIEGFHAAKVDGGHKKKIFKISLPSGFKPRNWAIRKTRFEPLDDNRSALLTRQDEYKSRGLGRHDLNPEERGNILGDQTRKKEDKTKENFETGKKKNYLEKINEKYKTAESKRDKVLHLLDSKAESFSKGEVLNTDKSEVNELEESVRKENEEVQAEAKKITKSTDNKPATFKPFIIYEPKQERYDKFIEANLNDDEEITKFLASIQPLNMSEWDREMEKKEFLQARKIYKPLKGLMSDRFVSEATVWAEKESTDKSVESKKKIEIKRTKVMWKPCSQLCKRFNVPEPFGGTMVEVKTPKKSRFSIFDYLETSINTRDNFVTPVIIPTKAEKPKPIIIQDTDKEKHSSTTRLSTKEIFSKEITKPREFIPSTSKQTVIDRVEETENITTEQIATTSSSTSVVSDLPKKSARPKSDLEKKIEELKNKHPSEKKDLFKAIFDSSSEDEADDKDPKVEEKREDEPTTVNTSKNIIDILKKTPAELNILRNTSPPRGIFAYLFKKKPKEPETPIVEESMDKTEIIDDASTSRKKEISPENDIPVDKTDKNNVKELEEDIYGPKIPTLIAPANSDKLLSPDVVNISEDVDRKLYKLLKKSKKSTAIVEEWVEKTDISKKSKKRKKEKDKKKKSKKHKKDKKSKR